MRILVQATDWKSSLRSNQYSSNGSRQRTQVSKYVRFAESQGAWSHGGSGAWRCHRFICPRGKMPAFCIPSHQTLALGCLQEWVCALWRISEQGGSNQMRAILETWVLLWAVSCQNLQRLGDRGTRHVRRIWRGRHQQLLHGVYVTGYKLLSFASKSNRPMSCSPGAQ